MFIQSNHYNIIFQNSEVLSASITKLPIQRLHPMKYMKSNGTVHYHAFLTLALDNCEQQLHRTSATVTQVKHSTGGGWIDPRATMHAMEKRKTSCFYLVPKLRLHGALSPLSHMPSKHATQMKHFTENC
jgi:hypothetical protein